MGQDLIDEYSLLHFAVGILMYFLGIRFIPAIVIAIVFEVVENSKPGMSFIQKYMKFWPGGKPSADSVQNSVSDVIFLAIGWFAGYMVSIK